MATTSRENIKNSQSQYVLVLKLDNCRDLFQILKALHFKDTAVVNCEDRGLRVSVEEARSVQASAVIESTHFQEFILKEESVTFMLNLTVLLECLNIFGSGNVPGGTVTTLKMCYAGYGNPLVLLLQENDVLTDCSIQTMEAEDVMDFDFNSAEVINKVILKSECLKDTFMDFDQSSEMLQISMSPKKPHLRFSTFGQAGEFHVDYTTESEAIETFECKETRSNKYQMSLLKPSVKPLLISKKVSIRTDKRGILCIQYLIPTEDGNISFIEYFCSPSIDEDNDYLQEN